MKKGRERDRKWSGVISVAKIIFLLFLIDYVAALTDGELRGIQRKLEEDVKE
jgi:hypothetical protein